MDAIQKQIQHMLISVTGKEPTGFVDWSKPSLYIAAASIIFNPLMWNLIARYEYRTHFLTKIFGSRHNGCYALALFIFVIGIVRDNFYSLALDEQPVTPPLNNAIFRPIAVGLVGIGATLVLTSMYALGVTGTYLGDYFGILMDEKVEGFPFSVTGAPMYWGSTCSFVGTALWKGRGAGLVLSALVYLCYSVALRLEDPFTEQIYAKRDQAQSGSTKANLQPLPHMETRSSTQGKQNDTGSVRERRRG